MFLPVFGPNALEIEFGRLILGAKTVEPIKFNFDLSPVEVPMMIGGEEYILREASGTAAITYRNQLMDCITLQDGKPTHLSGLASIEPLLVSLCLHKDGKTVPLAVVNSWPSRVVKAIYEKAKEISNLDDEGDDDENKEQDENLKN